MDVANAYVGEYRVCFVMEFFSPEHKCKLEQPKSHK